MLATTFALAFFELSDYDIWYHLKTGELIPANGVPQKDWYCFKSESEDWIDVHWGFQRVAAVLYGRFGSAGLVWMKAVAATLALAFALSAYRRGWPRAVQAVVWIVPLLLMSSRFYERPEIFTLVFTAIYLHVLFHAEEHPRRLWSLPFVQALWANVQGLFVFGPILLGMYWAEAVFRVDRVRGLFRHLMPATLLVFAACFVSPYGWRNLLLVMQISQTATTGLYRESIAELKSVPAVWQEGGYTDVFLWLYAATLLLSTVTTLLALPVIWRERRLFRLLPPIAFGYIGMQAVRNGNHFALVAGTVASWNLGSLRWKHRQSWTPALLATLIVGGLFYAVASEHWHAFAAPVRALGTGERSNYYPKEAMRKAGLPGMPTKALVMHNGHAAVYEYLNHPRKTFADARLEVHSLRTYKEYIDLCSALRKPEGPGESTLRREEIDLVAADGDQYAEVQAAFFNNPNWVCIHYDEITALFLRADKPLPDGAAKWDPKEELFRNPAPLVDMPNPVPSAPFWLFSPPPILRKGRDDLLTVRAGYVWEKMASGDYAPPENIRLWNMIQLQAARRAAARRPWKAESYRALGYAALGSSRPGVTLSQAIELPDVVPIATATFNFKRALEIDPSDFYARFWLGQTYLNLGAYDLAEETLLPLQKAWPRDRQQVKVLAAGGQLAQTIEAARNKRHEAESRFSRPVRSVSDDDVQKCFEVGLVGKALSLSVGKSEEVGRWHLLCGDQQRARDKFGAWPENGTSTARLLMIGAIAARGEVAEAARLLAAENGLDSAGGHWLRGWLAIQAGDRETSRKAAAAGKAREIGRTALALEHLEQLVK